VARNWAPTQCIAFALSATEVFDRGVLVHSSCDGFGGLTRMLLLLPLLLLLLPGLKPDQSLHLKALARRGKAHEGLKQHDKALQVR
jgi:hypothetical protein